MVRGKGYEEQYVLNIIINPLEAALICINGDLSLHSLSQKFVKGLVCKMIQKCESSLDTEQKTNV
jgi:hypothetical protein